MLLSRNAKILTAALLAVSLAACSTTKTADNAAATAAEQSAADKAAADKAAADAAAAAAAAASTNTGGVDSQSLADSNAKLQSDAANKANQLAATLGVKVFYFDYDQAGLNNKDYEALKAHALYLSKNPSARVQVGGNTDERGTREYNMALGERRAKAVSAFLTSNGAKSSQLEVISYGEEKPAAAGESEEAWGKNRRVELEYTSGTP